MPSRIISTAITHSSVFILPYPGPGSGL